MGGLISRAYRRMTQGNQQRSRNDSQSDQQQIEATNDPAKHPPRSLVESIPVGQSIDSAEYRVLEGNKNVLCPLQQQQSQEKENKQQQELSSKKKDIEEAAIKIQALVRGHLTRKALKDANQPSLNSLGQSQFDEESLTKNPGDLRQQQQQHQQGQAQTGRTPLESIAEVVETTAATIGASVQQTAEELADMISKQVEEEKARKAEEEEQERGNNNNNGRQKLASICQKQQQQQQQEGASAGKREASLCESRDSAVSPVPSETNASIDLNTCDTPASASASIDILDHNIRPTDRMASVLHPVAAAATVANQTGIQISPSVDSEEQPVGNGSREETICTPDSLDGSEEAAAIRIQSAFRGYRTRKNSPYRTRSPNSISASSQNNNNVNNKLRQQDAVVDDDDDDAEVMDQVEQSRAEERTLDEGRRESRSKQRDSVEAAGGGGGVGEAEESISGATVKEAPRQHLVEDDSLLPSLSLGLSEVGATETLDSDAIETPTAALESNQDDEDEEQQQGLVAGGADQDQRPTSIGETTGRSFDTDSSILGAALSMNDDVQTATDAKQQPQQQLTTLDEESAAVESAIESEARRLVEELEEEEEKEEEATNQLEAALEEPAEEVEEEESVVGQQQKQPEEQLAIELESDDIERRDPRGQASEERSRSPQISGTIELVAADAAADEDEDDDAENKDDDQEEEEIIEATESGAKLEAKKAANEPNLSGRSSPAADSDNGSSNESSDEQQQKQQHQQQQSQPAAGSPSKNKRRNRNKKRGKK